LERRCEADAGKPATAFRRARFRVRISLRRRRSLNASFSASRDISSPFRSAKIIRASCCEISSSICEEKLCGGISGFSHRLVRADRCGVGRIVSSPRTYCRGGATCARGCRRRPLGFPKAAQPPSVDYGRSKFGFFVFNHARVRPLTYRDPNRLASMRSVPWWRAGRWWASVAIVPHTQAK